MCISDPINASPWPSKAEPNFTAKKRSYQQLSPVCLALNSATNSVRSRESDNRSLTSEDSLSKERIASTGIMANLETFRRVYRQNGTDSLSYYEQTGQLSIERELALSTLLTYLMATIVNKARI